MSIKFKDVSPKITKVKVHGDDEGYVKVFVFVGDDPSPYRLCEYFHEVLDFHLNPRQLHGLTLQQAEAQVKIP